MIEAALFQVRLAAERVDPALAPQLALCVSVATRAVESARGDLNAARDYFEKAASLSPKERRYATELRLFHRRNLTANEKAARRRP